MINIGFHPQSKNIILFLGSILLIPLVASHKCYVCGPTGFDLSSSSLSCDHFDRHDKKFIQECLPQAKGCSVQINGTTETRACENIAIEDCKTANNVMYCYCTVDLCNASNLTEKYPAPSDDEDIEAEGSGHRNSDISVTRTVGTHIMTSVVTSPITEATPNISSKIIYDGPNLRFLCIILLQYGYYFLT